MTDLSDYGLEPGETIRFRPVLKPNGNWQEGRVRGVNKDGSLDVGTNNGVRAIRPERTEVKRHGPKGGVVWHVLVTTNASES